MKSGTQVNTLTSIQAKEYLYDGKKQYGWELNPGTYDVTV